MRRFYALCLAALALLVAPRAHAQTCTTSWTNAAGGAWETASNWSDGVPDPGDVACITLGGTYTVTTDRSDRTVAALVVGGASGTQTLTVFNGFTASGDVRIGPHGLVELLDRVPGGGDGLYASGVVTVEGVLQTTAGVTLMPTGTLVVETGGTLRLTDGAAMGGSASALRLRGEAVCTSGTCQINAPADVDGGTLRTAGTGTRMDVRGGGRLFNAALEAETGSTLNITRNGSVRYTVGGTIAGTPAGTVAWTGNTAFAAEVGGATLAVAGTGITLTGSAFLTSGGGAFRNTGRLYAPHDPSNFATVDGVTLRNAGQLVLEIGLGFRNAGIVHNEAAGVVHTYDGGSLGGVGGAAGRFENAGLLRQTERTNTAYGTSCRIQIPYDGLPGSVLRAEAGTINVEQGGTLRDVSFEAAEGTLVAVGGSASLRVSGTLSGTPVGDVRLYRAQVSAGPEGATFDVGGTGLRLGSSVALVGGGVFTNTGLLLGPSESSNFVALDGALLENRGRFVLNIGLGFRNGATLRNEAAGEVELSTYGSIGGVGGAAGRFENYGRVVKTGTGTSGFSTVVTQAYAGSRYVSLSGRLDLPTPAGQSFPAGATLSGTSEVYWPGTFEATGTISPGTDAQPIAPLMLWQYRPSLTEGDPRLVIDVGPNGTSDLLDMRAGASIRLGGTLVVRVRPGYVPQPGDLFTILQRPINASAITGSFANVVVEGAPAGITFRPEIDGITSVRLRAVADVSITASAQATSEGGSPITVVVRAAAAAASLTSLDVPLLFEGTARRFDDYTVDFGGSVLRIPAGATEARFTLFPRRDALTSEGDERIRIRIAEGGDVPAGDSIVVVVHDGPSANALAVDGVAPSRGADAGRLTATVFGRGFAEGASVSLVGSGRTLAGGTVEPDSSGVGLRAVFNLDGAPRGTYDVVVTSNGQTATLPGAFTVEERRGVQVWADIVGTSNPRVGRWSTYTVMVGNDGNADVHDVMLVLRLTNGLQYEFMEGIVFPDGMPESDRRLTLDSVSQAQVMPFWIQKVPAGATLSYRLRVFPGAPHFRGGEGMGIAYELYPPEPDSAFTWTGDFADGIPSNYGLFWGSVGAIAKAMGIEPNGTVRADALPTPVASSQVAPVAQRGASAQECPPDNGWNRTSVQDAPIDELMAEYGQGQRFNNNYYGNGGTNATAMAQAVKPGAGAGGMLVQTGFAMYTMRRAGKKSQQILNDRGWGGDGGGNGGGGNGGGDGGSGGSGGSSDPNGGPGTGGASGCTGGSRDPNDKLGPAGTGEERFVTANNPMRYTVRFENLATTAFPAQEVVVEDTLDLNVFDPATFSFGPIAFGERVVTPPSGALAFTAEIDLAPDVPATLLVSAHFTPENGRAVWTFTTLDPATRDLPEDGMVGFLPPNQTSPEGEGSVGFTVRTKPGLASGTKIENEAKIVFDVNDPIFTPVWSNTVDVSAPSTRVRALADVSSDSLTLYVDGGDGESGVQQYGLYVSDNDGPFLLHAVSAEPTFAFKGEQGHRYGFFSVASDFVLNVEGPKNAAETTTLVGVAAEETTLLPADWTLTSAGPNPARGPVRVRYGLPHAAEVQVQVFDLLGREVARLHDGEAAPGWHTTAWDGIAAPGLYVVRLVAETDGGGRTVRTRNVVLLR